MRFRDLIESNDYSEYGIRVDSEILSVDLQRNTHSPIMAISISGKSTLSKMKSYDRVQNEDQYIEIMKKYAPKIEEATLKYEKELNSLIIEIQNKINDI